MLSLRVLSSMKRQFGLGGSRFRGFMGLGLGFRGLGFRGLVCCSGLRAGV